ncbi:MAG TPA: AAA family ATPase [Acidobacteriota bacterium]|nr:AAA family ATPase [Acidobacteriota bacterium]
MYEQFYGLKEPAFNLTPDPSFLFLNKRSKDALDQILYGIERREGFAVIVGDVGTGKTTLCWALLERLAKKDICTALIQNPILSELDILKSILQDLGVRPYQLQNPMMDLASESESSWDVFDTDWMQGMSKKQLLDRLNMFLAARTEENVFTILIVDEAQNISLDLLEQLRLLSNLETAKRKLLQIIFVGQLELDRKLRSTSLRQLNQRISVRFETKALSRTDTELYIRHRIAVAGGAPKLRFDPGAFKIIWRYSQGYPRLINLICDRALLAGYSARSAVITSKLVRRAALGLQVKEQLKSNVPSSWFRRFVPFLILSAPLLSAFLYPLSGSK